MTLSTPILWVITPMVIAVVIGILHQRHVLGIIIASLTAFGLAVLAALFPQDLTLSLGPLTLVFEESLGILGRQIILDYDILPFIAFIYGMTGLWLLSSNLPGAPDNFRPISLVITASLTAAMGVTPFLYAALLIESAVLISIPMLFLKKDQHYRGILRYLSLQTIAMPFILIAGWLLTGVVILPPDSPLVGQTAIVLGLGFALLLAIFPFHSWVPMLSEQCHPTVVSYLLFILPTTILVFGLNFLNRYAFLRTSAGIFDTIRMIGVVMIVIGGIWTATQEHLKRAFGYSALVEIGFSLLAIGLSAEGGLHWMLMLFPARALGYWLWGYTLTRLESHYDTLDIKTIQGCARKYPLLASGLLLAQMSIAGLPLLASFPVKITLLTQAISMGGSLGLWGFVGNLGLFLFTIRLLLSVVTSTEVGPIRLWEIDEKSSEYLPILVLVLILIIIGLFPHTFLAGITNILTVFPQLQ